MYIVQFFIFWMKEPPSRLEVDGIDREWNYDTRNLPSFGLGRPSAQATYNHKNLASGHQLFVDRSTK